MSQRCGFTLAEIAISLLIFTVAILTVIAMLPSGYRAQATARQQAYAAAAAVTMMESFHNPTTVSLWGYAEPSRNPGLNSAGGRARMVSSGVESKSAQKTTLSPTAWRDGAFSPGWIHFLNQAGMTNPHLAPDLERTLSSRIGGLIPLPDMIAQRLDSDGGEIARLLADGGSLYYIDPGVVRGLRWGNKFERGMSDSSKGYRSDHEIHKIVIGVVGSPQQNTLIADPIESWPWYEMYPFPPAWGTNRGMTSWAKIKVPNLAERTANAKTTYYTSSNQLPDATGVLYWGEPWYVSFRRGFMPLDTDKEDDPFNPSQKGLLDSAGNVKKPTDGGFDAWAELGWIGWRWQSRARLAMLRVASGATLTGDEALWWQSPHTAAPNDNVWQAFRALSAGDVDRVRNSGATDDWGNGVAPPGDHPDTTFDDGDGIGDNLNDGCAGWVAVRGFSGAASEYAFRQPPGSPPMIATSPAPAAPESPNLRAGRPDADGDGQLNASRPSPNDKFDDRNTQIAPGSGGSILTYEVRASYRDRAIDLWNTVRPSGFPELMTVSTATGPLRVPYVMGDADQYEFGPTQLDRFPMLDPMALAGTTLGGRSQFPPHPAQVMALSFLAHSAMVVSGLRPPFRYLFRTVDESRKSTPDTDLLRTSSPPFTAILTGWDLSIPTNPQPIVATKDVKLVASGVAAGAAIVPMINDTPSVIVLHDGDCLWFEQDPDRVHEVNAGGAGGILSISTTDAAAAVMVTIRRSYTATDTRYVPLGSPGLGAALTANSRALRVASPADLAFARRVHEMSLRWAVAYGRENNLDWGAPRPLNIQVATDRPISIFDLWYDAGANSGAATPTANAANNAAANGMAQRRVSNPPPADANGALANAWSRESIYRWIYGRNPSGPDPVTGNAARPSNIGNPHVYLATTTRGGGSSADGYTAAPRIAQWAQHDRYWSMWHNGHIREPTAGSDVARFWPARNFEPEHRGRELVFWGVDWKQYEDAEIVPSAVMDMAKLGVYPSRINGNRTDQVGGPSRSSNYAPGVFFLDNPEAWLAWSDPSRNQTGEMIPSQPADVDTADLKFGHYGADRNANGVLDRGPVPASARMRATTLVRMNFYDPILTIHAGN
jgi:hypothetical protein